MSGKLASSTNDFLVVRSVEKHWLKQHAVIFITNKVILQNYKLFLLIIILTFYLSVVHH
jgi:hypothetical protein